MYSQYIGTGVIFFYQELQKLAAVLNVEERNRAYYFHEALKDKETIISAKMDFKKGQFR